MLIEAWHAHGRPGEGRARLTSRSCRLPDMHPFHRCLIATALVFTLTGFGGCAGPRQGLLTPAAGAASMATQRTILAVTTRATAGAQPPGYMFSGERSDSVSYAELTFSFPPGRTAGDLPVDADAPDPQRHITLVSATVLDPASFARALAQPAKDARSPNIRITGKRKALVFVHGYNTAFDAAAVRMAQIVADTRFTGTPVLFSWPSRGGLTDYAYDRASADFSRDALERLLKQLARNPEISGVDVFAHSMGNWLTMEALRQLAVANDQQTLGKIREVVLAAPDVDMDVFRQQTTRMQPLPKNMTVYVSRDDYALRVSRRLAGGKLRAGENTDLSQFHKLGMEAHDLSLVEGGIGRNHGKAFEDASTLASIGHSLAGARSQRKSGELLVGGLHTLGHSVTAIGEALLPSAR